MKSYHLAIVAGAAVFRAAESLEEDVYARCHIYWAPEHPPMSCGGDVERSQVDRWQCGDTVKNACISTEDDLSWGDPRCDDPECFEITYHQPEIIEEFPLVCKDGKCPAFTRRTYIKAVDYSEFHEPNNAIHEMSQVGWERLCPYLCAGESHCVEDPATCLLGTVADEQYSNGENIVFPGVCKHDRLLVTRRKIPCDGDDSDGSPVPGQIGEPFPPHGEITTTSTDSTSSSTDSTSSSTDSTSSSTDSTSSSTDPNSSSTDSTSSSTDPNSSSTDPTDPISAATDPESTATGPTPESSSSSIRVLPSAIAFVVGMSAAVWLL